MVKDEFDKPEFIGVIRWDNNKDEDFEDWRGQFGTFQNLGGKVLNKNYPLKFINDDGSLK